MSGDLFLASLLETSQLFICEPDHLGFVDFPLSLLVSRRVDWVTLERGFDFVFRVVGLTFFLFQPDFLLKTCAYFLHQPIAGILLCMIPIQLHQLFLYKNYNSFPQSRTLYVKTLSAVLQNQNPEIVPAFQQKHF